ncbi:DUF4810 domain-containing protein [Alkalimonas delamerensis]|uniref:DUF4810 domain-containing protein n=1 Tax=Alkalimonas delamerensis TaxID=265981 RepID=A0ABT9GT16_9GAMM|nr:DUF4810 domain-containing protein [Alkalimonas delamerensis]MDP4530097.1 DUF4810 domain-containing protein [Alkalimonas delamerensis]
MKKLIVIIGVLVLLSACKTTDTLYYHGEYNKLVYTYFKGDSAAPQEQIAALHNIIQTAESKGKPVAPGVHAHLGLLYFESGDDAMGQQHFEYEKTLFPESAQYLDFLLSSRKGV